MKKTLVLGASTNPARYAYLAVERLLESEIEVVPVGIKKGEAFGIEILNGKPALSEIHTVTLYLSAKNQKDYYDYIIGLKPKRIIFNPGTENPTLAEMAKEAGIETLEACTLVMLSLGNY